MRQTRWALAFLAVLGLAALAPTAQGWALPASLVQGVATVEGAVRSFGTLDARHAWVLSSQALLLTEDGGATWREVTPPRARLHDPATVAFIDRDAGWLAEMAPETPGVVVVAATTDGGRTWQRHEHQLFAARDPAGQAGELAMHWLDRDAGWLVVRQKTSSNFNQGTLFGTQDGGASWQQLSLPGGAPVFFISETSGWSAGGPNGDTWFRTDDGGVTWTTETLPEEETAGRGQRRHYLPHFTVDGQHGVVVVTTSTSAGQRVRWYATHDRGVHWEAAGNIAAALSDNQPLARLDAAAWLMASTGQPLQQPAVAAPFFANPVVTPAGIAPPGAGEESALLSSLSLSSLALASAEAGWAMDARGARLLYTDDGGRSWRTQLAGSVALPAPATTISRDAVGASAASDGRTARLAGPGFDKCELASEEDLRRWLQAGPYRAVNLYIGGALRACDNVLLDAQRLATLAAQGWTFIPTWVGPQAPCTGYRQKFDFDAVTAFAQGRGEATRALQMARQLGLADETGAGTVIYYDLEAYDGEDAACVEASRAFVAGWTQQLQTSGSYAGLYALACNPPMSRYAELTPAPDTIWFAAWTRQQFDPAMTVWNLPSTCLPSTLWQRQQRIRQYTGGHDETWGGVTLEIDSNALDGIVADLSSTVKPRVTVVVESPEVSPVFNPMQACANGWHRFTNIRGEPAYLAFSQSLGGTIPPLTHGIWRPTLPITGTYHVEALIASHGDIDWPCRGQRLGPDTSRARYTIYHQGASRPLSRINYRSTMTGCVSAAIALRQVRAASFIWMRRSKMGRSMSRSAPCGSAWRSRATLRSGSICLW